MPQPAQTGESTLVEDFIRIMRLRPNSEKAFRAAMQLRDIDGIGGVLAIKIPEKLDGPLDIACTVGRVELVVR